MQPAVIKDTEPQTDHLGTPFFIRKGVNSRFTRGTQRLSMVYIATFIPLRAWRDKMVWNRPKMEGRRQILRLLSETAGREILPMVLRNVRRTVVKSYRCGDTRYIMEKTFVHTYKIL